VGGVILYCELRKSSILDAFGFVLCTANVREFHSRPPEPLDEDRSTTRASHSPMREGDDIATTGGAGEIGLSIERYEDEFM
jgi:hypothetical protein